MAHAIIIERLGGPSDTTSAEQQDLKVDNENAVLAGTLNRSQARNAITHPRWLRVRLGHRTHGCRGTPP